MKLNDLPIIDATPSARSELFCRVSSAEVVARAWGCVKTLRGMWEPHVPMAAVVRNPVAHVCRLAEELREHRYMPHPAREFTVVKGDGGTRLLHSFYLRDRMAQRMVLFTLRPLAERIFHPASYGYRPLCTTDMAVARAREQIRRGYTWIVDADIEACFDRIPHWGTLAAINALTHDADVIKLVVLWLQPAAGGMSVREARGLPQGMVLSPLLCNLYLHPFDCMLTLEHIPFVRFADDFLLFARSRLEAVAALDFAREKLSTYGLELNASKTRIAHAAARPRFLGQRLPAPQML